MPYWRVPLQKSTAFTSVLLFFVSSNFSCIVLPRISLCWESCKICLEKRALSMLCILLLSRFMSFFYHSRPIRTIASYKSLHKPTKTYHEDVTRNLPPIDCRVWSSQRATSEHQCCLTNTCRS